VGHDLLGDLLSAGFLDFPHTNPPDPQTVGGPGQIVAVVTGGRRDPAVPFASFMLPFVEELLARAVPVAVGEPVTTAHSFVQVLRTDAGVQTANGLVTVDDLASAGPQGGLALVLALRDLVGRQPRGGNYGVKHGSSGLLPASP
jgi:hypothetical protein